MLCRNVLIPITMPYTHTHFCIPLTSICAILITQSHSLLIILRHVVDLFIDVFFRVSCVLDHDI